MKLKTLSKSMTLLFLFALAQPSFAGDVLAIKSIGLDLARDIASETIKQCRKMGYQVSAVVVDRSGNIRAALRDDFAARFTLEIAERKANMVVMAWTNSGDFRDSRADIRPELNHINGLIVMEGGIPVTSGGNRLGAIGVSGAPGGDKDEACAAKALQVFEERLEFAD